MVASVERFRSSLVADSLPACDVVGSLCLLKAGGEAFVSSTIHVPRSENVLAWFDQWALCHK